MSETSVEMSADAVDAHGRVVAPKADSAERDGASTRERILDVALELFAEKGFDGTTLREIAERLGFTKAALYYHYPSKEDIFMALHLRMHEVGRQALHQLAEGPVTLAKWESLLVSLTGEVLAQRKLFLMHERNQAVLERFHRKDHDDQHDDLQARLQQVLSDRSILLRDRVRMAASIGTVFGVLFVGGDAFDDCGADQLGQLLQGAIHDVLRPGPPASD